jgi:hypothetical protein
MARPYLEVLTKFVADQDPALFMGVEPDCRHFFSGAALYLNGAICLTLTPVGLGLKLPDPARTTLLQSGQAQALQYFPKAPIKKGYVLFPDGLETEASLLVYWTDECVRYALDGSGRG